MVITHNTYLILYFDLCLPLVIIILGCEKQNQGVCNEQSESASREVSPDLSGFCKLSQSTPNFMCDHTNPVHQYAQT